MRSPVYGEEPGFLYFQGVGMRMERVMGIEPTLEAWEAAVLPLNYTRIDRNRLIRKDLR